MTKQEAWEIIHACRNWNTSQTSIRFAFDKLRAIEDDILDAKRAALAKAWLVVGEEKNPGGRGD